ncbi:MAG TPA: pre-peptidase C-terminal domain-containing protein [Trichocoleus sp.]|jgi:hypothetical protein
MSVFSIAPTPLKTDAQAVDLSAFDKKPLRSALQIQHLRRSSRKSTARTRSLALSLENNLGTPEGLSSPFFSTSRQVDRSKPNDLYQFSVDQSGIFTADLAGLSGDADVRLISDRNRNSTIDPGEVLAWQWERGTQNESIRRFVQAGTYFLQVASYNNQTANYALTTNFTPATSDNRQFSVRVTYGQGLRNLGSAARNAITEAAKFWEQTIAFTSFNQPQTLTINVTGTVRNDSVLAFAGPRQTKLDANGRALPTSGAATVNTRFSQRFNNNPTFLKNVIVHEFGHVLGLGTLWQDSGRNLINPATNTYEASSYAGLAYGELTGSFTPTAVPVEPQIFGHWDEAILNQELMTPIAEAPDIPTPLSQLTIASLRDLGWNVNYGAAQLYSLPASNRTLKQEKSSRWAKNRSLPFRCGCAYHMAANSLNTLDASQLSKQVLKRRSRTA